MTFQRVRLLLESLQPTRVTMDPKPIKLTIRILPNHPTKDLRLVQSLRMLCLLEDSLQMGSKLLPQSILKLSKYHDNFPELANCYWLFFFPIFIVYYLEHFCFFWRLKSREKLNFSPTTFGSPATITTHVGEIDDLGQSGSSSINDPKVDLSDLSSFAQDDDCGGNGAFADELGFTPLQDSYEDTPMVCTPRANSRIVRIVSKHSNVWQS